MKSSALVEVWDRARGDIRSPSITVLSEDISVCVSDSIDAVADSVNSAPSDAETVKSTVSATENIQLAEFAGGRGPNCMLDCMMGSVGNDKAFGVARRLMFKRICEPYQSVEFSGRQTVN